MSKKKHQSFYEIGGLILGSAFDLIARPVKIPKGYKTKKINISNRIRNIIKLQKHKKKNLRDFYPRLRTKSSETTQKNTSTAH